MKIDCSRQTWTERTNGLRLALLELLSEPKIRALKHQEACATFCQSCFAPLSVKVSTFIQNFYKIVIAGLYAGTLPSLAANVAENSILFAAYGACQKMVASSLAGGCRVRY